ncbi:MAG: M56 family metallopeptidase [Rikenellaceae bacterium]
MTGTFVIALIKYIGVSCILWGIYILLFKEKASFKSQRIYLLLCPILAIIAATISIKAINIEPENALGRVITKTQEVSQNFNFESTFERADNLPIENVVIEKAGVYITTSTILFIIWGIIALYVLTRYVIGIRYVMKVRKLSSREKIGKYSLCRSGIIETPFSFFKCIFISRIMDEDKFDMILKHEIAHIRNLHYVDKLISQTYITLSWFNPIVWRVRKELEYIHEFEADYDVLNSNCDKKKYKQFIFDEISYDFPIVANGFNGSLIKQRFIQMKNNYQVKYKKLRTLLTIPSIILLLTLTSFTYVNEDAVMKKAEEITSSVDDKIISVTDKLTEDVVAKEETDIETENKADNKLDEEVISDNSPLTEQNSAPNSNDNLTASDVTVSDEVKDDVIANDVITRDVVTRDVVVNDLTLDDIKEVKAPAKSTTHSNKMNASKEVTSPAYKFFKEKVEKLDPENKYNFHFLDDDNYTQVKNTSSEKLLVYKREKYTEVDLFITSYTNFNCFNVSQNTYLEDTKTKVRYKIHSIRNNIPLSRNLVIPGMQNSKVYITLIFPPLGDNVKSVNLIQASDPDITVAPQTRYYLPIVNYKIRNNTERPFVNTVVELDPDFKI